MQLSKNKIKFLHSLQQKKFRDLNNVFLAEGKKLIKEITDAGGKIKYIVAEKHWLQENNTFLERIEKDVYETSENTLRKISSQKTPQGIVAVIEKPDNKIEEEYLRDVLHNDIAIYLDDIQDPGNMGTLLRTADWFGIRHVFVSNGCVDIFNPKTIQSSMGAIGRVDVVNFPLQSIADVIDSDKNIPVCGAFLEGENIYNTQLSTNGLIVLGNEANGISNKNAKYITQRLAIPSFEKNTTNIESLNVAIAGAIICSEFRRRTFIN